jgi:nitrite reductase/ring-hydroxylating ferredoxin subunit
MADIRWIDVGAADELAKVPVQEIHVGKTLVALTHHEGTFGVVSGVCNHVGGPLGQGRIVDGYLTCPWHGYKYHVPPVAKTDRGGRKAQRLEVEKK